MIFLLFFFLITSFGRDIEAREPTIREVQAEAIHYLGCDQQEMDGWKRRARWAAALPRLQAGLQRDLKDLVSLSTKDSVSVTNGNVLVGPAQNNFDQNFNQGTSFDLKAVWYLNELAFSRDSLAVSSERRDWARERERVLQGVTEAYFTRKRLQGELKEQVTATLDAYTGGWFSQELGRQ